MISLRLISCRRKRHNHDFRVQLCGSIQQQPKSCTLNIWSRLRVEMATTDFREKPRIITPGNTRRNEIIAILLLAVGLLLTLCLVSAAFYPSDPSWNSAGQTVTRNWAGSIGANVAALLFQSIGIAAYLLPFLLLTAAWRRFRTRSMR